MTKANMKQLEKLLVEDVHDTDDALMSRLRPLVKEFLLEEAARTAKKQHVRDEAALMELIRIHAHVAMLKKLVDTPTAFGPKDLKELVRETAAVGTTASNVDPLAAISALDVPDAQKAQMIAEFTELAKTRVRAQLEEAKNAK